MAEEEPGLFALVLTLAAIVYGVTSCLPQRNMHEILQNEPSYGNQRYYDHPHLRGY